ncbi:MAG: NAD(P)-dependent oxidoreductase [Proteobacteria bacterium]|nr:NAD(P)-dependent oxidoreductase [Pseudomonadota bacterium]
MVDIEKELINIGWIGTGVMGQSMCRHLMDKGFAMTVYNRSRDKAESLIDKGAKWVSSPSEVAKASDVVFTMLGFPKDVEEVYMGKEGIFSGVNKGSCIVDMTTTSPSLAKQIYALAKEKGVHAVDAPVSGGDVGARSATLSIMVGGNSEVVEKIKPLLEVMGKIIVHQGPAGSGQHAKMCNQIVIAGTMIGVCESLIYGYKAGLDMKTMLSSISGGAAACWTLDNMAPRILKRDFDPGFFVEHFIKDMGIALDEAKRMELVLPGLALANQLYMSVLAHGGGKSGTQALMLALEQMSNLSR